VSWTKLESTTILFKGEDKIIWTFIGSTIIHMRATQHFHRGILLGTTQQKKRKRNSKKHTKIFLEFLVFLEESKLKKENKNEKNYLHEKAPNKQKKNREIFLGFYFNTTTK
jgi:hypothetical protein